jgi:hypothetical protein
LKRRPSVGFISAELSTPTSVSSNTDNNNSIDGNNTQRYAYHTLTAAEQQQLQKQRLTAHQKQQQQLLQQLLVQPSHSFAHDNNNTNAACIELADAEPAITVCVQLIKHYGKITLAPIVTCVVITIMTLSCRS